MDQAKPAFDLLPATAPPAVSSLPPFLASPAVPPAGATGDIEVPRDLAVQLIGSDAGKRGRCRPHGAIGNGATAAELDAVQVFMKPFLEDEIKRCTTNPSHRPKVHRGKATVAQAQALKACCLRYAAYLQTRLAPPRSSTGASSRAKVECGDSYRNAQRLAQAEQVIDQINHFLGLDHENTARKHIRTADTIADQMLDLHRELAAWETRAASQAAFDGPADAKTAVLRSFVPVLELALEELGLLASQPAAIKPIPAMPATPAPINGVQE